jgi:hypothetical protein
MFKKCYLAIIGNEEGQPIGSIMVRCWRWKDALWVHRKLDKALTNGNIIDFKRVK